MVNSFQGHSQPIDGEESERAKSPSAAWLLSPYDNNVWVVCDTMDRSRTRTIDFRFGMPGGKVLPDFPHLYETVKGFAFWIRDPRISSLNVASGQLAAVSFVMAIAHRAALEEMDCFSSLLPYDIDNILEDAVSGVNAILKTGERLDKFISHLDQCSEEQLVPYRLRFDYVRHGVSFRYIRTGAVLREIGLPSAISRTAFVSAKISKIAKILNLRYRPEAQLEAVPRLVGIGRLGRCYSHIETLFAVRRFVPRTIGFRPFTMSTYQTALAKAPDGHRTPTVAPKRMLALLESATEYLAAIFEQPESADGTHIVAACWILIAAFTGRRADEISRLAVDCIEGSDQGGWWLRIYVGKTEQRLSLIPVPRIVVSAVEILVSLSKEAREAASTDSIFLKLQGSGQVVPSFNSKMLDRFSIWAGVTSRSESGELDWHWAPHQFRRFFAVFYFYRFEGASIEVLSHHLRHYNIEMTRRYLTEDPDAAAIWLNVEWGYQGELARSIVSGERQVGGAAGRKINSTVRRLTDLFRRRLWLRTPERIGASLVALMRRQGLVLTPKPWVTCTCPRTARAAALAACRRIGGVSPGDVGPDFSEAGPTVCGECPHAIMEARTLETLQKELGELQILPRGNGSPHSVVAALQETRAVVIRRLIEAFMSPTVNDGSTRGGIQQ